MTPDGNEENLSMEDILSSIKNILEENEKPQTSPQTAAAPETEPTAVPEVEPTATQSESPAEAAAPVAEQAEEGDSVFNLSPSMMIENPELTAPAEVEESIKETDVALPELEDVSAGEAPETIAEDTIVEEETVQEPEEVASEVAAEEPIIEAEPEIMDASPLSLDEVPADAASDPIYEPEDDMASADAADISPITDEDTPIIEDEFINQNLEQGDGEVEDRLIDDETINEVINRGQIAVDTDRDPTENMTEIAAVSAEETPKSERLDDEAVDVSADIINNFAKIFSEHKGSSENVATAYPTPEANTKIGMGAATLEDLVKAVIRDIIAEEIKTELSRSNLAVDDIALEEIKAQTKTWLNENLPAVVESVVQKEIERVMVKVGRN